MLSSRNFFRGGGGIYCYASFSIVSGPNFGGGGANFLREESQLWDLVFPNAALISSLSILNLAPRINQFCCESTGYCQTITTIACLESCYLIFSPFFFNVCFASFCIRVAPTVMNQDLKIQCRSLWKKLRKNTQYSVGNSK